MRVLHLFSNYKWTGPSDPAVSLAAGLLASGVDIVFRSSGYQRNAPFNYLGAKAEAKGLQVVTDLQLPKHHHILRNPADVRRLSRILREDSFDLIHCHLKNDFRIARRALRRIPASQRVPIVRTIYDTDPDSITPKDMVGLSDAAAIMVFSKRVEARILELGYPAKPLHRIEPSIDLDRFSSERELPDLRTELGFSPEDYLVGIVARVQPQRNFDLLLDMAEQVSAKCPGFRLIVIGRGSKLEWVAREPARKRGLLDRVVFFPGFFDADRYVGMLKMLDVKLFLVPGTDGTARAVREALAMARPVICTPRGMLPELVHHGETGFVCEEQPEPFASAVLELATDESRRRAMGEAARADAESRFSEPEQIRRVTEIYESLRPK